ncbi:acid-sensing ion channel 1C [Xenopus laevis]|uniref:Acid-sensing ion channel 1C n=1 Tax=Xenopus laevis TaxID=8355 RepID=A0A8J1L3T6_XENLA|nr:acid-sensing ion channel 1C [Xenopus laevis]
MDILKPPQDEEGDDEKKPSDLTVFAGNSTLHGISHVFLPGGVTPRRVFWACSFLASLSCFLFQVADRIIYYSAYHHVTTLDEMESSHMKFPAITICNFNRFRRSKLTPRYMCSAQYLLGTQNVSREELAKCELPVCSDDANKSNDTMDFFDQTGHSMKDMLLECRYRNETCGPENFTTVFTRYGKCYTFNSGKKGHRLLNTLKGGTGNGLELMLDIQQNEYLPVFSETDETSYEAGIKVQIHSQIEPPYIHELGFGVPPGFQTFVATQEQQLVFLPPPWGNCKDTPLDSFDFKNYSITACRIICQTEHIIDKHGCRMVHMPGNATVCPLDQYEKADKFLDALIMANNQSCPCGTPCRTERYQKELSMVKIPSNASAKYLAKKYNKSVEYIRENILVLDIFFEALNYEMIEQKEAYEVAGLLGDIGGQMGLFIGASILTILEIFDYLYEVRHPFFHSRPLVLGDSVG